MHECLSSNKKTQKYVLSLYCCSLYYNPGIAPGPIPVVYIYHSRNNLLSDKFLNAETPLNQNNGETF